LTLSGVKGALTLIMVYSLPYDFEHREMFEAIIVGNILLTTFIYTLFLIYFINFSKEKFKKDIFISDEKHNNSFDVSKTIKNYIEKDYLTKAYNKLFIEELIDKEILRANRYKISLSVVGLKLYNLNGEDINYSQILQQLGEDVAKFIRATDYFGKLSDEQYIILATNTSINGAVVLANKLHKEFKKLEKGVNIEIHFGVTQVTEFDTKDVILDKINDAVSHKSDCKHSNCIDIEV
jgi:CPA1 family monovalent cation:H+ antiporter